MSTKEKEALVNELTLKLAEDYDIKLKELRLKITDILDRYHVTISDERFKGENLTTEYLWKKFFNGKSASGMSVNTLKQYKIAINLLEKHTEKSLANVEADDLNKFLKEYGQEVSSVTLKGKYQLISSVYNWLYARQYIPYNPVSFVDSPKAEVIFKNPLSNLELESIKKACETIKSDKESLRDMALLHTFISTGCRVSEIAGLKISDVDFDKKVCIVLGKGKKYRPVVLNDSAIYRIKLYLETRKDLTSESPLFTSVRGKEHKLTKDGIEKIIHKLRDNAGLSKLTCHVFRRYYATNLRKRNVPVQMIASSLGHSNLNQINRYSLYNCAEMNSTIYNAM